MNPPQNAIFFTTYVNRNVDNLLTENDVTRQHKPNTIFP